MSYDKGHKRLAERWGVNPRTVWVWSRSPKRAIRFRYEAAISGALGVYGNPKPPTDNDPSNLVTIERAAVEAAGYSKEVLWDWYNNRAQKATREQLANRVHDLTEHYLRATKGKRGTVKPKYKDTKK